ncbi:SCO family protein [Verrucomicrobiaceae bacterium N1E253]|uniref:SCO family protein n=1 Tax=Oceaniferula marina TaxID=2748318 RepID=A0A851GD40_9BACT|nr:SCO family protein [Oceaniferula marina]NWK55336.1 SCO family protein [Oceaniferula marina]
MTDKGKITLIYLSVAAASALILATTFYLRNQQVKPSLQLPPSEPGIVLSKDLTLTNQDGKEVKLSDLKGKVWAFAQFYATCPMCAKRNSQGLKQVYETFKGEPGFQLVCITVNPEEDSPEKMKTYAESLGADTSNWWFLTGDPAALKSYMVDEMKYDPIQRREDPDEAATKGELAHNMSIAVYDRNMGMVGRRDLYSARQQGDAVYQETEKVLHDMIRKELDKK